MSNLKRYMAGLPLAAGLTFGLAVLMMVMIRTDGVFHDTRSGIEIEGINPVEQIVDVVPRARPPKLTEVAIPPAPPIVDTMQVGLPSTAPISAAPAPPPMTLSKSILSPTPVTIAYREKAPIQRTPPIMPGRATRSGHCKMIFDISAQGSPYNVRALSCSQSLFEAASIKAVQKWRYMPEIRDGQAASIQGQTDMIRYNLVDGRGKLIAE